MRTPNQTRQGQDLVTARRNPETVCAGQYSAHTMTEPHWPAWALTSRERCKQHHDPGCAICTPPLDEADYRPDDPEAGERRYERHIGLGPDS